MTKKKELPTSGTFAVWIYLVRLCLMSEAQLLGCTCFRLLSMWHDMRQEVDVEMT
jgi:hypothetical protein